jgi:CBS domain containing-hemolysin-like protein
MLSADPNQAPPSAPNASIIQRIKKMLKRKKESIATHSESTERLLIGNIEDLGTLTAEDVMVPRIDILAIELDASADQFLELLKTTPHSRIPVYQDNLDEVLGFVHIKDVLRTMAQGAEIILEELLRPVMIVSPAMPALDLLVEMRKTNRHLSMVIDEYGGIDGLVTMGDLVEAIVGELSDEHNIPKAPRLMPRKDGSIIADARYTIDMFEEQFGECFAENERQEADTLGGLVMFMAGRLPSRGEIFTHDSGISIEIVDADPRRVKRLRLRNVTERITQEAV